MRFTTTDARRLALVRRGPCDHGSATRWYGRWQEGGVLGHLRVCGTCGHVEGLGAARQRLARAAGRGYDERGLLLTPYRQPEAAARPLRVRLSCDGTAENVDA